MAFEDRARRQRAGRTGPLVQRAAARVARRAHRLRAEAPEPSDAGFTLIEMVVAVTLLGAALIFVALQMMTTLSAVTVSKQRTVATAIIAQTISQAQALPWSTLQAGINPNSGLSNDSLSTDPNVTVGSSDTLKLNGATIATSGTSSSATPITPHIQSVSRGGTSYTVYCYPTLDSSNSNLIDVVVIVKWRSPTHANEQAVGVSQVTSP